MSRRPAAPQNEALYVAALGERGYVSPHRRQPILTRQGPVVDTILEVAHCLAIDLIAMPTGGRHGLLGALRGSVTARILDDAHWPLLAVLLS